MGGVCDGCKKTLTNGELYYCVKIILSAGFDGVIPEEMKKDALKSLLKDMENLSEKELMAGVHEELSFILCASCRQRLRKNPLSACTEGK